MIIESILETSAVSVAIAEHCVFLVWRETPFLAGVRAMSDGLKRAAHVAKNADGSIALFSVVEVEAGGKSPPPDVRKALSDALTRMDGPLGVSALLYEADGFRASIVRSVVSFIDMVSRRSFDNSVFSNEKDALDWFCSRLDRLRRPLPRSDLEDTLGRLRRGPAKMA